MDTYGTTERSCSRCSEVRPISDFPENRTYCRSCRAVQRAEFRAMHPDVMKAHRTKYYAEHRDGHRALTAKWHHEHKGDVRARQAGARADRPEIDRARDMRHRAKSFGAPGRGVTAAGIRELLEQSLGLCSYCGKPTEPVALDHIEPLQHGGAHELENLAPCCTGCNSSKGSLQLVVWLARRRVA
jgi:5-methylcytosine-specific restriction endonuclease McrA